MEKGNSSSSNSNNDVPNFRTATRIEYWPSFYHYPANRNEIEKGDYKAMCRTCYHTFKYNIHEEGHELDMKIHYQWHINGGPERERKEYLELRAREHEEMLNKPKNYDWYKDYYTEPKPIQLENPRGHYLTRREPTHYSVYEKIYEFRGDHTVSCTKCGQVLNYKENILRDHYNDHKRQEEHEKYVRDMEHMRVMKEREKEAYRQLELREEKKKKKLEKQIEISLRYHRKREEDRKIAAAKMTEIEQQEAAQMAGNAGASQQEQQESHAAFWNEAAQMAANAGASQQEQQESDAPFWNEAAQMADNAAGASQQQEQEHEEPWWDEILKYVNSQNL